MTKIKILLEYASIVIHTPQFFFAVAILTWVLLSWLNTSDSVTPVVERYFLY